MNSNVVRCSNCGYVLSPRDLEAGACPYCHAAIQPPRQEVSSQAAGVGFGFPDIEKLLDQASALGDNTSVKIESSVHVVETERRTGDATVRHVQVHKTVDTGTAGSIPQDDQIQRMLREAEQMLGVSLDGLMDDQPPAPPPGAFRAGQPVSVAWSDGRFYPAQVVATAPGRVQVRFQDGREMWVAQSAVRKT